MRRSICLLMALLAGCTGSNTNITESITLATTTSPRDSGLLDYLLPNFTAESSIEVKVVAVGSGQALAYGERGDADVLLVHSPEAESQFMAAGHGESRAPVMTNDFVIVGPAADPAKIRGGKSAAEAFRLIHDAKAPFISRGDESGTHVKEKAIWGQAGLKPPRDWYKSAGQGMGAVLRIADEQRAYTLVDRGTLFAQGGNLELDLLVEGDSILINPYSVIVISPQKHPHIKVAAARRFAAYLRSAEGRRLIAEFGKDKFGQSLFVPAEE